MPSGGYGINEEDMEKVRTALADADVQRYGLQVEWCATYATARSKGASPDDAAVAAYAEWDL